MHVKLVHITENTAQFTIIRFSVLSSAHMPGDIFMEGQRWANSNKFYRANLKFSQSTPVVKQQCVPLSPCGY